LNPARVQFNFSFPASTSMTWQEFSGNFWPPRTENQVRASGFEAVAHLMRPDIGGNVLRPKKDMACVLRKPRSRAGAFSLWKMLVGIAFILVLIGVHAGIQAPQSGHFISSKLILGSLRWLYHSPALGAGGCEGSFHLVQAEDLDQRQINRFFRNP
jgi:hypothetical protein